jgi:hypothetical protein
VIWIAISCLALGALGILRGAVIVAVGSRGRFRGDAAASLIAGFALALTGQFLLQQL